MRTKGDCLAIYLRILDEATKKGIAIPATKNADYRDKFNYFLNDAQIYVAQQVKIPDVYEITQNPIENMLGLDTGFELQQYLPGGDSIVLSAVGAKSYYFEIDNVGTVTVEVNGVVTEIINNTEKRKFTAYKNNTGASGTDAVTITFSGIYPYNVRNTALFAYPFPTAADVPDYTPFVEYAMPTDFLEFDIMINKSDPKIYQAYKDYKWENNKKVILNYYDQGSFDIHYFKYPVTILPTDADTVAMTVEDKAIDLVVLQAGVMATAADNPALSSWLRSLYTEKIQNVLNDNKINETSVQSVYTMM